MSGRVVRGVIGGALCALGFHAKVVHRWTTSPDRFGISTVHGKIACGRCHHVIVPAAVLGTMSKAP